MRVRTMALCFAMVAVGRAEATCTEDGALEWAEDRCLEPADGGLRLGSCATAPWRFGARRFMANGRCLSLRGTTPVLEACGDGGVELQDGALGSNGQCLTVSGDRLVVGRCRAGHEHRWTWSPLCFAP